VLTAGEAMALLDPEAELTYGASLTLRMAGAECNFAIALARLGVPVAWVSRVGADPMGDLIVEQLSREGIDLTLVRRDERAPTGMYYKARAGAETRVHYYRHGSAASRLAPADVPDSALDGVELVHLTGITLALSDSCADLVTDLARRARERGAIVIFDPNWRPALWESPDAARDALTAVIPSADWVLCGAEEARVLFGADTPQAAVAAIRAAGAADAVVRVGAAGAVLVVDGKPVTIAPERAVDVIDEVGAGDAFAAGFAYGLLSGWAPADAVRAANRLAAAALQGSGDWETLPYSLDPHVPEEH
jgi:2-dehydro-3-deoxygluconokinase